MKSAIAAGHKALISEDSANPSVDAVIAAVSAMEDNVAFNAGFGSYLNEDGNVQMDAIVMEGKEMKAGAVGAIGN